MQNAEQKTALIAMSGGVDSSIAAYLMRQADFRCMGTTMRLYQNEDIGVCRFHTCCAEKDIEDASEIAFQLDIPYAVIDFTVISARRSSTSSSAPMRWAAHPTHASTATDI